MVTPDRSTTADHYSRANLQFLVLNWLHLPLALLTAALAGQSFTLAALGSVLIALGPSVMFLRDRGALSTSISNALALLSFSALLIHLSGGMTELHFHIFASLGLLITLAQPLAVAAALLLVVVHHVGFFILLPASLINYQASFGILVIHALFALAIGVPAIFIARRFRTYIVGVKDIVDDIQSAVVELVEATQAMRDNSQTLAASTTRESAAARETASALEQLNAMIGRNSESAGHSQELSTASKTRSDQSLQIVTKVVGALDNIRHNNGDVLTAIERSNNGMKQIIQLIQDIESKTRVINDIVFQTKLLSFNASIEAARADEHGKGFSVVAEEVGNLARMSGASAQEISQLLAASVQRVNEITTACQEQAIGVSEITRTMSDIESASQQNNQISIQVSDVAQRLADSSQALASSVGQLVHAIGAQMEAERAPSAVVTPNFSRGDQSSAPAKIAA